MGVSVNRAQVIATLVIDQFGGFTIGSRILTVQDPNRFSRLLQSSRYSPHVAAAIDVPFGIVSSPLRCEAVVSMLLSAVSATVTLSSCVGVAVLIGCSTKVGIQFRADFLDYIFHLVEQRSQATRRGRFGLATSIKLDRLMLAT